MKTNNNKNHNSKLNPVCRQKGCRHSPWMLIPTTVVVTIMMMTILLDLRGNGGCYNSSATSSLSISATAFASASMSPNNQQQQQRQPPRQEGQRRPRRAYIIGVYGGTKYLCGAAMVAWNLRNRNPGIDLVAFVAGRLSDHHQQHKRALDYLHQLGYKTYDGPLLYNSFGVSSRLLQRNSIMFSKLNMYALTDYYQAIYLDTDYFIPAGAAELDRLFDRYDPSNNTCFHNKPIAFQEGEKPYMNGGMILYQPNATIYHDMLAKFNTIESFDGGDQGFQSTYFSKYHKGYEYFPTPEWLSVVNVRKKSVKNIHYVWPSRVPKEDPKRPIHMFGVKVWQCPRDRYCAESEKRGLRMIWPQLVDLWWQYFDEMADVWPFVMGHNDIDMNDNTDLDVWRGYCVADSVPATVYAVNRTEVWGRIHKYQARLQEQKQKRRAAVAI
eukprot:CAMPEP_0168772486 /NCGR_PEP_ID=MMETSP0725-20121227/3981_1 /TAXON_ID=265536 /ORGANISM="Amphiprora sp., Strain CCMP467" /LENGTH=438 /DNA_ID=CAMNT_0008822005 /DNA_START=9 /DNA_END=1325 /DNA_ORIENTATION=+